MGSAAEYATYGDLFRCRSYPSIFLGSFASNVGSYLQVTAVAFIISTTTNSEFLVSLNKCLSAVPLLFLSAVAASHAERGRPARILLWSQYGALALSVLLAAMFWRGNGSIAAVLAVTALFGVVSSFASPAWYQLLPRLVGESEVPHAISLSNAGIGVGWVIGPMLAGFILHAFGPAVAFGANALSFLAFIGPLMVLRRRLRQEPRVLDSASRQRPRPRARDAIAVLRREPRVRLLATVSIVTMSGAGAVSVLLPTYATQQLGYDASQMALLYAAKAVGTVPTMLMVPLLIRRIRSTLLVPALVTLTGVTAIAIGLITEATPGLFLLLAVYGALYATTAYGVLHTLLQTSLPASRGAEASAVWQLVGGTVPVVTLIWGLIGEWSGSALTFVMGGAVTVFAAVVTLPAARRALSVAPGDDAERAARAEAAAGDAGGRRRRLR